MIENVKLKYETALDALARNDYESALVIARLIESELAQIRLTINSSSDETPKRASADDSVDPLLALHPPLDEKTCGQIEDEIRRQGDELQLLARHLAKRNRPPSIDPLLKWLRDIRCSAWPKYFSSSLGILAVVLIAAGAARDFYFRKYSLLGTYFDDLNLTYAKRTRHDPTIDFDWGLRPPLIAFRADGFSIRWTGYLKTEILGVHEFRTISDDGVVLWIDGQKVIDDWTSHAAVERTGIISLKPGYHKIQIDYFDLVGNASIRLLWRRPTHSTFEVIPSKSFRSEEKFTRD